MENQMMSSNLNNVCVSNDGALLENNGEQPLDLSVNVSVNRANGDEAGVVNPTVASVVAETIAVPVAAADEGLAINEANASVGNAIEGNAEAASISGREVGETAGASADSFVDVSTHNEELDGATAVVASNPANTTDVVATATPVIDCPICLQTCIHPARLPCGHIFCFLCVKGVAYKNRRCAMCRREIPTEYLEYPQLVNGIEDICSTKATEDGYQWFYEGRNGGWWAYDNRTAQQIEEAYRMRENVLKNFNYLDDGDDDDDENDLHKQYDMFVTLICGNIYVVDFKQMVQYPQYRPSKARKVNRAKHMTAMGVAGIRYINNHHTNNTINTTNTTNTNNTIH